MPRTYTWKVTFMQILKGIGVYLEVAKFDHFFGIEKKRNIYCIVNMQKTTE